MSLRILRTCVGCRTVRDQGELVRLAIDPVEGLIVNPRGIRGRGAYLCPAIACLERAWQRKALPRAFRRELPALDRTALRERFEAELKRRGTLETERTTIPSGKGKGRNREEGRVKQRQEYPFGRKSPRV